MGGCLGIERARARDGAVRFRRQDTGGRVLKKRAHLIKLQANYNHNIRECQTPLRAPQRQHSPMQNYEYSILGPTKYRPITYLLILYKLITICLTLRIYKDREQHNIFAT